MNLQGFNLNVDAKTVMVGGFMFFLLFAAILTVVMLWHWKRYGFNAKGIVLAEIVYLTGLVILLGGSFFELTALI